MSKVQTLNPSTLRRRHRAPPPPDLTCAAAIFRTRPSSPHPLPPSHHPSTHCNGTCCLSSLSLVLGRARPQPCWHVMRHGLRGSSPICTICMRVSGLAGPGRSPSGGFFGGTSGPADFGPVAALDAARSVTQKGCQPVPPRRT